jgi:hypothetical protein
LNWDAIAAIAEAVGAAGVIATLAYLGLQVRQNTRAIRVQTYDSFVAQFRNWNEPMRADPEMTKRWAEMLNGIENVDPAERDHAVHVMYDFIRLAENLHYQYREGMVADSMWSGWECIYRAYLDAPGMRWYFSHRRAFFCVEFCEWVDELHRQGAGNTPRSSEIATLPPNA